MLKIASRPPTVLSKATQKRVPRSVPSKAFRSRRAPVGDLRWQPPQPVKNWKGVRKADQFGPRCMQRPIFADMNFRSNGMSEDCLYLNIWTPAKSGKERLPVLVYFYGGGFVAGDGSEPRYDGESMARKGIVAVTVNYRLGVFGFLAHPELTKESPHHASGNYGLLDQTAALRWVQQNIAAFGGDPKRVTIAGESAGSISVSAQMASPLSKDLIAGAIGESGSIVAASAALPLAEAEQNGIKFATSAGATSLAELRAMPAEQLLDATAKPGMRYGAPTVDGYLFPKPPAEIYAAGEQAKVPLLVGSNSEESGYSAVLWQEKPTLENYRKALQRLYGDKADEVFKLYSGIHGNRGHGCSPGFGQRPVHRLQHLEVAGPGYQDRRQADLLLQLHAPASGDARRDGEANRGIAAGDLNKPANRPSVAARSHSAEIEYAMGNLDSNKVYAWTPDDYKVSKVMQEYFANFIKTGNPNGPDLPTWPTFDTGQRMTIDVDTRAEREKVRTRYQFLDQFYIKK